MNNKVLELSSKNKKNKDAHFQISIFAVTIFLLLILNSNIVSSMNCIEYEENPLHQLCTEIKSDVFNTTLPIINITFQESVQINNFFLYRLGDLETEYPQDPLDIEENEIQIIELNVLSSNLYQPKRHVNDGVYMFRISALNLPNVQIDVAVFFEINGTSIDYWVTKPVNNNILPNEHPNFAVSNTSSFLIELEVERPVEKCKFTVFDYGINSNYALDYYYENEMGSNEFITNVSNANMTVYLPNFNITNYYAGINNNGELRIMYIICKEAQGKYSYNEIYVGYDESPTTINVVASPNPVVDYMLRKTNLTITTSDRSVCTISKGLKPDGTNKPIINRTPSYDFEFLEEFENVYAEQFTFNNEPSKFNYTYIITCDNLANFRTNTTYQITVDMSMPQSFEFYSPRDSLNSSSVFINGSTSIGNVTCQASLNSSNPSSFITLTKPNNAYYNGRQIHTGTITSANLLREGQNTVYVNCTYMGQDFATKTFTIDRVAPTAPNITMELNSCSLREIKAKVKSTDNTSGIDKYYYTFDLNNDPDDEYHKNGTTSNGDITYTIRLFGDEIIGRQFTLSAWAVDNAGNTGARSSKTITVTNSSIQECDKIKPRIKINTTQNLTTKEWKVIVSCSDIDGSGCRSSYNYGIETNSSKDCEYSHSGSLLTPLTIYNTSTFCAVVYDNNDNNASDEKELVVSYPASCTNFIKDKLESDIDCGGDCPKCINGDSCKVNSDCARNFCLGGICTEPKCNDTIQNGIETGIDCGGNCNPCAIGARCLNDADCLGGNCLIGVCVYANCTDLKKDGIETDIDCGGNCSKCGYGKKCFSNSDCTTGYCDVLSKTCNNVPSVDDPNSNEDEDKYEETKKKINKISIILFIIGILLIIAGVVIKVLEIMDEQKQKESQIDFEMKNSLEQIPKLATNSLASKANAEEENYLRQQARNKNLKLKEIERRKVMNQFGEEEVKPINESKPKTEEKVVVPMKAEEKTKTQNKKYLDADSDEEYIELGNDDKDAFTKLKEIANEHKKNIKNTSSEKASKEKSNDKIVKEKETNKEKQKDKNKGDKKEKVDDEIFEKLKKVTKQAKAK